VQHCNHDIKVSCYDETIETDYQLKIHKNRKVACTYRLSAEEKDRIFEIIAVSRKNGKKLSENQIVRIAINSYGENF